MNTDNTDQKRPTTIYRGFTRMIADQEIAKIAEIAKIGNLGNRDFQIDNFGNLGDFGNSHWVASM